MFQYAFARANSEITGLRLTTDRWIGEEIFDLPDHVPHEPSKAHLPVDYRQNQESLIYTRSQVKNWFKLKPEIEERLQEHNSKGLVLAHRRTGDYGRLGYVVVSEESYHKAAGLNGYRIYDILTEEKAVMDHRSFIVDFYRMMTCSVLFRGNSTFSWWAATLGNSRVFSPVIEGLEGGKEQECEFVEGNYPRFADLPFVTDLHLSE